MASNQALIHRITALSESIKATVQLIARLSKLSPDTHPSSDEVTITPEEARAELTADIQEALKQEEEELELLKQDVDDTTPSSGGRRSIGGASNRRESERERDAVRLATLTARVKEDLKTARSRFRRAQLQAKRNADQAAQRERTAYIASLQAAAVHATASSDENETSQAQEQSQAAMSSALFAGRRTGGPRKDPKATQDDLMLSATSDVTASLRRTHALLASEVSRSRFAQETLDSSNKALEELNERYSSLDTMLSQSRGLLNTLLSSNKSDTWYLETAYMVLAATIGWLVFRRFLYGPMWWFIWLPIRTVLYSTLWILGSAMGLVSRKADAGGTTTSLTVMPSATARGSVAPGHVHGQGAYVSAGADSQRPASVAGSLSESIGTMVESMATEAMAAMGTQPPSANNGQGTGSGQGQQQGQQGQGQRGDGQPLRERDEVTEPRNPKKRMMEEPPPPPAQQEQQQQQQQKRDEL